MVVTKPIHEPEIWTGGNKETTYIILANFTKSNNITNKLRLFSVEFMVKNVILDNLKLHEA